MNQTPDILTQELEDGTWRAWIEGSKLSCIEKSRGHAIKTIKELWFEKLECDLYLEEYAKGLKCANKK